MAGKLILFQGDSITDGNRYKDKSQEWDLNHQIGHAYPYVIAATLGARYPERRYVFRNRGVSGNQIAHLFARWKADTLLHRPDVLSVLIGVNDLGETGSEPARFERVYRVLLDEALAVNPAMRFTLIEPFLLPVGGWAESWDEAFPKMQRLQEAVARVAQDYGAVHVPLQQKFFDLCAVREKEYWLWDGVHPTEAGHGVIAFEWMKRAESIL